MRPHYRAHHVSWHTANMSMAREVNVAGVEAAATSVPRALARLRTTTGADLTFSGLPEAGALRLRSFDGPVAGPLRTAALDAGHGLGGRVLVQHRPIALQDYVSAESILHTYDSIIRAERLRAMVAAPVIVGRRLVAVLYAAMRIPQFELGRLFDAVAAEARALEQTMAVASVLSYRSAEVDRDLTDRWRDQMLGAYLELRAVAAEVTDRELQLRIRDISDRMISDSAAPNPVAVHLAPRERDVLVLVAGGHTNAVIAERLGISLYTVKGHLKSLMSKLDSCTRFEVVVRARQAGLLP